MDDSTEGSTEGLSPGFWDPIGCSGMSFWTLDNDQTVGYLRHAEIKHGRIAMAGFLGYCAVPRHRQGRALGPPVPRLRRGRTPQEQWDNIPVIGKLQILTFVGMLESYGEIPGDAPHYTAAGGKPNYPPIKGNPCRASSVASRSTSSRSRPRRRRRACPSRGEQRPRGDARARGPQERQGHRDVRQARLQDAYVYSGDIMVLFEGQFHVNEALGAWTEAMARAKWSREIPARDVGHVELGVGVESQNIAQRAPAPNDHLALETGGVELPVDGRLVDIIGSRPVGHLFGQKARTPARGTKP